MDVLTCTEKEKMKERRVRERERERVSEREINKCKRSDI